MDSLQNLLLDNSNQSEMISELNFHLGMGYGFEDDIIRSTEHFLKAIQYSNNDNVDTKVSSYIILTHIYLLTGKYDESNYYLKKIVDIHNQIETDSIYFSSLSYVAGYHSSITKNIDSAIYYEKTIINNGYNYIDKTSMQAAYFNLASNYTKIEELDSAYKFIQLGFKVNKENLSDVSEDLAANRQLMFGYYILCKNYLNRSKPKDAFVSAKSFVLLAEKQKDTLYIYRSYNLISTVFYKLNLLDSAYLYQKNALKMYKVVVNSDKQNELNEVRLQTEYSYNRKLDSLKSHKIIQDKNVQISLQKEKKDIAVTLLIVGAIFLLILLTLLSKLYNSKNTITSQKNQVEKSLKQNEYLLSEAHHRVKNNLQIVSSLLDKQANISSSEKVKEIMKIAQGRIQSMALLHNILNQEKDFHEINFELYVKKLVRVIYASYANDDSKIEFKINIKDHNLKIDTVIPLGLIINELVSNSLIHAFRNQSQGEIVITVNKEGIDYYNLIVADDGIGMNNSIEDTFSLGLELVQGLAWQLGGKASQINSVKKGMSVKVTFTDSPIT